MDAKRLVVKAISGKVNPADIATKILSRDRMQFLLRTLSVKTVDASGTVVGVAEQSGKENVDTVSVEQIVCAVVARLNRRA